MKKGLSSTMEPVTLCCSLYKALTLDPVPVIGDMIYVPGVEGFNLSAITEDNVKPCPLHKFNFEHTTSMLLQQASINTHCSCESTCDELHYQSNGMLADVRDSPFVHNDQDNPHYCKGGRGRGVSKSKASRRTLWAYEMDNVVTVYKWLIHNRNYYPKCCNAVIVYQLRKSPPGLYVYKTQPSHFGCTAERPIAVVEQFNYVSQSKQSWEVLPNVFTIDMFPGHENFSVLYVMDRKLTITIPEYVNRMYGEARALGITCSTMNAIACNHHEVAMRTDRCVL